MMLDVSNFTQFVFFYKNFLVKNIGILTQSQFCISSSSSDSTGSDDCTTSENTSSSSSSDSTNGKTIEPEVNQDHYASPFQRQSAKDGAKVMTCFGLFIFLIFNPLSLFAGGKGDSLASGKLIYYNIYYHNSTYDKCYKKFEIVNVMFHVI